MVVIAPNIMYMKIHYSVVVLFLSALASCSNNGGRSVVSVSKGQMAFDSVSSILHDLGGGSLKFQATVYSRFVEPDKDGYQPWRVIGFFGHRGITSLRRKKSESGIIYTPENIKHQVFELTCSENDDRSDSLIKEHYQTVVSSIVGHGVNDLISIGGNMTIATGDSMEVIFDQFNFSFDSETLFKFYHFWNDSTGLSRNKEVLRPDSKMTPRELVLNRIAPGVVEHYYDDTERPRRDIYYYWQHGKRVLSVTHVVYHYNEDRIISVLSHSYFDSSSLDFFEQESIITSFEEPHLTRVRLGYSNASTKMSLISQSSLRIEKHSNSIIAVKETKRYDIVNNQVTKILNDSITIKNLSHGLNTSLK